MEKFTAPLIITEGLSDGRDDALCAIVRQSSTDSARITPYGLLEAPSSMPSTPLVPGPPRLSETLDALPGHGPSPVPECEPSKMDRESSTTSLARERPSSWVRQLIEFTGPGWLMSVAYIDPGNLEADLQCGAQFGYGLLWALLYATTMGLGMQLVAARLGCATRRHLAEHCQEHYPWKMRIFLWVMTEFAIIGSDIQEVIGCSIGIRLLFGLPIPLGVVVTAIAAFGFLFLERLGARPLELFFVSLIFVLALSMGGLFAVIKPDPAEMLEGLVLPRMPPSAVKQVVGMLGCVIMPHNLFLHSALVQSRVILPGEEANAVFFFAIESSVAIFTSLLINMSVVAVFAKGFFGSPAAAVLGLGSAGHYLGDQYGGYMRIIWGLGLCAAGQSSTMTGAYAGQWVMQGYLQLQVKSWKRAIITRSMALCPTLLVAFCFGGGNGGLDAFNEYLNLLQAIVLPFAVVPLLTFVGNRTIMGSLVLSPVSLASGWIAACLIMAANIYMMIVQLGVSSGDLLSGNVRAVGATGGLLLYTASVAYVAWVPRAAWRSGA
mmetsp:Transcript_101377/g.295330  ORF Transcript_101377/g.295330 Transcript_101377/m.295330 type:complete len:548 (-) Transcript_101377:78-1721(-)